LASGDAARARAAFQQELDSTARALFAEEFVMDAHYGLAFTHLGEGDAAGAVARFDQALARYPEHARSLIGRGLALTAGRNAASATDAFGRASASIAGIRPLRPNEANLAAACLQLAQGDERAAVQTLEQFLAQAPPGLAGWTIPVEPLLAPLRHGRLAPVLAQLSDRAR
jgi:tetratricopeptide (TPR) repeat protein